MILVVAFIPFLTPSLRILLFYLQFAAAVVRHPVLDLLLRQICVLSEVSQILLDNKLSLKPL